MSGASKPTPEAPKAKAITEEDVRAIVRQELADNIWLHDAGHSVTQERLAAQSARDTAAGIAAPTE